MGLTILLSIILPDTTKKCDRNYYTKPMLPVTLRIIMSLWTTMTTSLTTKDTTLLPLPLQHLCHLSASRRRSRYRLLTPNVLLCKIALIRVRVY